AVNFRQRRVGAADDTAAVVSAGGDGIQAERTNGLHEGLQLPFAYAVKLNGLARGDAQAALGILLGNAIEPQPLRGAEQAARNTQAHHELINPLQLAALAISAQIAVILLIDTMEFHQQWIVAGNGTGDGVDQPFGNIAAQII